MTYKDKIIQEVKDEISQTPWISTTKLSDKQWNQILEIVVKHIENKKTGV